MVPIMSRLHEPRNDLWFALCVGILYVGHPEEAQLKCTHDDLERMQRVLRRWGYPPENIKVLADRKGSVYPTRDNIIAGIHWLVDRAIEDPDTSYKLLFYYSGHGGQERDEKGMERNGWNQAIIPCDARFTVESSANSQGTKQVKVVDEDDHEGYIIDDELNKLMAKPLPVNSQLLSIFDCCRSGTALDLQYQYVAAAIPSVYHRAFDTLAPPGFKSLVEKWHKRTPAEPVAVQAFSSPTSRSRPVSVFSLPIVRSGITVRRPVTQPLGLEPDLVVEQSVELVVSTSIQTISALNWLRSRLPLHWPRRRSAREQELEAPSRFAALRRFFSPAEETAVRAIDTLLYAALSSNLEREMIGTVWRLTDELELSRDFEPIDGNVMSIGACSDNQLSPDSKSVAKMLEELDKLYGSHFTNAELLIGLSRLADPQIPRLSASQEMTRERWGQPFAL